MPQSKQNPDPSASAQEIAEKLALEAACEISPVVGPYWDREDNKKAFAVILSAITAAVAEKESDEVLALRAECDRKQVKLEELQERYDLLAEMARDYDDRANRGQKDSAAVAQSKREDTARLDWLEEHDYDWRELEFSDQGLRFAIDSARNSGALELKEPSPESNLSTQNAPTISDLIDWLNKRGPSYVATALDVKDFLSEHSNAAGAALGKQEAGETEGERWQNKVHQAYISGKPLLWN